jgi:hypothetical protein
LSLKPTEEDLAALHADGYLGDVIDDLHKLQQTEDVTARDALAHLARLLRNRQPSSVQAPKEESA